METENRKRKRRVFAAVLGLSLALGMGFPAEAAEQSSEAAEKRVDFPQLNAGSAVLMDGDSGRVLYGKDENMVRPMASTTKIMTCILALENSSPDALIEVSDYAASMPDVQLNIRKGEKYRLKDLLYSLMLESHNDTAMAIAEHVAGSREEFAKLMNRKARDIGCTNTYFLTPNGLDAKDGETGMIHSTTAAELAQILRYCILKSPKREEFLEITRAPSHAFSDSTGTRSFSCINHNALLTSMEGAVSGKTGFTNGAGYCYVGAVKKGEKLFIAALLGCGWPPHKTWKWQDMEKLIRFGNKEYEYREILKKDVDIKPVPVVNGIETQMELKAGYPENLSLKILMREDENVTIRKKTPKAVAAPVEAGTAVGQIDYYVGESLVASYPIKTAFRAGEWTFEYCLRETEKRFWLFGPGKGKAA